MKEIALKFIYFVLASFARAVIKRHQPFVIAITGSVGKTSTKEAVFQVLHDKFGDSVRKTFGSLNAEIGIPLTILGYDKVPSKLFWSIFLVGAYFKTFEKKYPKYLVLEMGVEHPGDISYFQSIVEPNIGIITSTEPVHLVNFSSQEELAEEKMQMLEAVNSLGKVIINSDDKHLAQIDDERVITIGIENKNASYRATDITLDLTGTTFRIETTGQKIAVKSSLLGRQFAYANLFAFVIGQIFEIQSLKIKQSLEKIKPVNGRMRLLEGRDKITIIDDTYNANPASVKAALETLSAIKYQGRKVAILGNMNELGYLEKSGHKEVGDYAMGRADLIIFIGKNGKTMATEHKDSKSFLIFADRAEFMKSIDQIILPGDLVLIKASQNGNYFEEITKYLLKDPHKAKDLLVRQSDFWLKKKN